MNGIIYCRVSSKEQLEGTSLESQELSCREYARNQDITVLKTFVERGESAKFADRTQLLDLIEFCRQNRGKIQVLLVWKIDRFARNVGDHFNIKAMLAKYGVQIRSVTEPIDSNAEGRLMETILAGFAQFDNDVRAMRSVQGMRRKIQEGIHPWKAPLGYKASPGTGEKKTLPDQPDRPLFDLLQRSWKEFATGIYTKAEMGRLMATWGILTRSGKPLGAQSLGYFFSNPFYAGILADPWSGNEYPGQHIPMVTPDEYAKVQQIIRRRNRSIPHQKLREEFPLRGLVRCNSCHRFLTGSFTKGRSRRYAYYHCPNRACAQRTKSFSAPEMHGEFEAFLGQITPKSQFIEQLRRIVTRVASQRESFIRVRKVRVDASLEQLNRSLQELIRMRAQQLITNEEFLEQRNDLTERRAAIQESVEPGEVSPHQLTAHLEEITEPLIHLGKTWKSLPAALRSRFHQLLMPVGFVNGQVGTAELGLLFKVFRQFPTLDSSLVPPTVESWNQLEREIIALAGFFKEQEKETEGSRRTVPTLSRK